jgi:hypothetical protein
LVRSISGGPHRKSEIAALKALRHPKVFFCKM